MMAHDNFSPSFDANETTCEPERAHADRHVSSSRDTAALDSTGSEHGGAVKSNDVPDSSESAPATPAGVDADAASRGLPVYQRSEPADDTDPFGASAQD